MKPFLTYGLLFFFLFLSAPAFSQNINLADYKLSRTRKLKLVYRTFKRTAKLDYKGYSLYFDFDNFAEFINPSVFYPDSTLISQLGKLPKDKDTIYLNPYLTADRTFQICQANAGRRIKDLMINIQKIGSTTFENSLTIKHYKTTNKTGCIFTGNFYFLNDGTIVWDEFLSQSMTRGY